MFNRRIITIAAVVVAVIAIIIVFTTTYIVRKENIQFLVAPRSAQVTLNGQKIESNKPIYVAPGTYSLSITADKFRPVTQSITITDTYKSLAFCLLPKEISSEEYLKTHPEDEYICEGAAGQAYLQESQAAIDKYPVIERLPYENGTYAIGQGLTEKSEIALYVHYSNDKSKKDALDWIHRFQKDNLPPIIYTDDYEQTGRLGGTDSQLDKALADKYSIIKILPIDAVIYKIGYRLDPADHSDRSIILTIKSDSAPGRKAALAEIRAQGYDPTDFKIEFIDFESEITS